MPQFVCHRCGKTFTAYWKNPKFCSNECKRRPAKHCQVCGKLFHNSHDDRVCCSPKCMNENKRLKAFSRVEKEFKEPIYHLLYRLYHVEKQSIDQIAKLTKTSDHIIWDWMEFLGIPRRNKSTAVQLRWMNDPERIAAQREKMRKWIADHPEQVKEQNRRNNIAQQFRKGPTNIERLMQKALNEARVDHAFQYLIGGKFLCDFALPDYMLIIECDGIYWHNRPEQRKRDASKDAYLRACGFTIMRFTDKEIEGDIANCIHRILDFLKLN